MILAMATLAVFCSTSYAEGSDSIEFACPDNSEFRVHSQDTSPHGAVWFPDAWLSTNKVELEIVKLNDSIFIGRTLVNKVEHTFILDRKTFVLRQLIDGRPTTPQRCSEL